MPRARPTARHASRGLIALLLTAMLLVWLPVDPVIAQELPPETKGETLETLEAEAGSNVPEQGEGEASDAEAQPAAPGSETFGDVEWERSEPTEAPFPFTGLGLRGTGEQPVVRWRALTAGGTWTAWHGVEATDLASGPDPDTLEARAAADLEQRWVSDAIWVGEATHLQLEVEHGKLADVEVTVIDSGGLSESMGERFLRRVRSLTTSTAAEASIAGPAMVTRAQWGADESWRTGSPNYAHPRFAVLHHTATTNDYTRAQAPQQVRNMYYWHTHGNGWNDLGYNFVVDRFGTIYEGRHGGVDRGVIGAHAANYNSGSFGVAVMGNYNTMAPTSASLNALTDVLAWKFDIHWIDPSTSARTMHNGQSIPTLVGHRNVRGSYSANPATMTDCPGQQLYSRMSNLRSRLADGVSAFSGGPWRPVTGDWNGDGRTTIGWFRDGVWRLRNSNSAGSPSLLFAYGAVGDLPVVGDWNGDGRTTVGVVRDGRWLLRNANSPGEPDHQFWYGRGAIDYPMAGDWNGNGRDTPAIVRDGEWHLRNSLSGGPGQIVFTYGRITLGDLPVVGDWNGNGRDSPGILRDGEWHLRNTQTGGPSHVLFVYGRVTRGDVPIVGDWNGNGRTTVGVTRTGEWHLRNSLSGGPADLSFHF